MVLPSKDELFEIIIGSSIDFAIFTIDETGNVTSWNIGAERLFGYPEREMLGGCGDLIFTPEDRALGAPERERMVAIAEGRALDERWHQRKDGSRFWGAGLLMPLRGAPGFVKIARDRSEQHHVEECLRENEERFRLLATSIPQLVFLTRPDGNRTWGSPQWIAFTGLSLEESLGFGWLEAVHPEDRKATQAAWDEALETGNYYAEHRVKRQRDGAYRWHQTRAKPLDHADRTSKDWVGTMTDIHELRSVQDRQQVLMAELQHRTRNVLAVVQSIASHTMRSTSSIEAFSSEFGSRLRALGRVQSLLARAEKQAVDLGALVEAELAAHGDGQMNADKIKISGPRVDLPAAAAQALGLAVHELVTNAVKYGALAHDQGKLAVVWDLKTTDATPRVALHWVETGVAMPTPAIPPRKGYGSQLIERALPYQLAASTKLEFRPEGIACTIEVPVPSRSEVRDV
jgi:PAS domain S-box-containing protein